eukprot:11939133-Alexandrium_andersonii.AAC.1
MCIRDSLLSGLRPPAARRLRGAPGRFLRRAVSYGRLWAYSPPSRSSRASTAPAPRTPPSST